MPPSDLAAYQLALSELLVRERDPDAIARALATDPAFEPFRAYVTSFEPSLLELVARLSIRWSDRTGTAGSR